MKSRYLKALLGCLGLILGTGCANRLLFATKTSIGLDISGTSQMPDKVAFTFGRYEGAIVPRSTNGDPYSVYGSLDADVKWIPPTYTIRQTFATGRAAQIASGINDVPNVSPGNVSRDPLFFVTDTTFGLKISAGKQDISPTLLLGYKRVEGTVIPVAKNESEARSVYADIVINSSTNANVASVTNNFPNNSGVRIRQSFATGKAADSAAATNDIVREKLKAAAAGLSVDEAQAKAVGAEAKTMVNNAAVVAEFVWQPAQSGEAPTVEQRKARLAQSFHGIDRASADQYAAFASRDALQSHLANGFTSGELATMAANTKH